MKVSTTCVCLIMFIIAVCLICLLKLKWPKNRSVYVHSLVEEIFVHSSDKLQHFKWLHHGISDDSVNWITANKKSKNDFWMLKITFWCNLSLSGKNWAIIFQVYLNKICFNLLQFCSSMLPFLALPWFCF